MFESSQTPHQGILHSTEPGATGAVPVHVCTGTPVARGEERIWELNTNADICRKAVDHESLFVSGYFTEFHGWTAKTADIGTSI